MLVTELVELLQAAPQKYVTATYLRKDRETFAWRQIEWRSKVNLPTKSDI